MIDHNKINLLCNTLNAQQSLSNHLYARTKDKRENDLSIILRNTQIVIRELQDEIECLKGGANENSRADTL